MCNNCNLNIDTEQMDEFGQKLLEIVNHSSLSLMISIGHRARLFDIMSEMESATSDEIAAKTDLNERYVREWLGAMVTGGIIQYDPAMKTYLLPAEHAALLTRAAGSNNFATTMQWFSVLGSVEDQIVDCFQEGGGVPYSEFSRFHEVMAEESFNSVVSGLFEHILPLVPGLDEKLNSGIDVLDIGCGSGLALIEMAATYPQSRFTGYDFSGTIDQSRNTICRAARSFQCDVQGPGCLSDEGRQFVRSDYRLRRDSRSSETGASTE